MTTFTNQSKHTITPQGQVKGYARQAVYGIGVYGLCVYGVGTPNFGVITNESRNAITFTNQLKH